MPLFKANFTVAECSILDCTLQPLTRLSCSFITASHKGHRQTQALPFLQHSDQFQEPVSFHFSSLAESLVLCDLRLQHFEIQAVGASKPKSSRSAKSLFPISRMKEMKQRQPLKKTYQNTLLKPEPEHTARLTDSPQHHA